MIIDIAVGIAAGIFLLYAIFGLLALIAAFIDAMFS